MRLINADVFEVFGYNSQEGTFDDGVQFVLEKIDATPTIDAVAVKHGRWLRTDAFPHRIYCFVCFKTYVTNEEVIQGLSWDCPIYAYEAEYCPHCGAKMDRRKQNNEY